MFALTISLAAMADLTTANPILNTGPITAAPEPTAAVNARALAAGCYSTTLYGGQAIIYTTVCPTTTCVPCIGCQAQIEECYVQYD